MLVQYSQKYMPLMNNQQNSLFCSQLSSVRGLAASCITILHCCLSSTVQLNSLVSADMLKLRTIIILIDFAQLYCFSPVLYTSLQNGNGIILDDTLTLSRNDCLPGLAELNKICQTSASGALSVSINKEIGMYSSIQTATHELGHK